MRPSSRPLRALVLLLVGWAGARTYILWPDTPIIPRAGPAKPDTSMVTIAEATEAPLIRPAFAPPQSSLVIFAARHSPLAIASLLRDAVGPAPIRSASSSPPTPARLLAKERPATMPTAILPTAAITAPSASSGRLSLSAWLLTRGGAAGPGNAATLGGSQAGVRVFYAVGTTGFGVTGRLSTALRGKNSEGSAGIGWRSERFGVLAERRFALSGAGRDDYALIAYAGLYDVALPFRFKLDGYAQGGFVGLKRRDGFADGAGRVEREIIALDSIRLGAGGGLWAAAQPHVSRVDAGPQLVAHFRNFRLAGEYRLRIAGNASPGSGPALSLGADF